MTWLAFSSGRWPFRIHDNFTGWHLEIFSYVPFPDER
jgi:hypothetical protein